MFHSGGVTIWSGGSFIALGILLHFKPMASSSGKMMADVIIDVPTVPDVIIEVEERVFRQVRWGWQRFRCILNTNPQDKREGCSLGNC